MGQNGTIKTSIDGDIWVDQDSGTNETLNRVVFNPNSGQSIVVGTNNVIIASVDGSSWNSLNTIKIEDTTYNVQGDEFTAGYGPEELVPGIVTDNLTMLVNTRPGVNWDTAMYQNMGYNVTSVEIPVTSGTQYVYSFAGAVAVPAQISVYVVDSTTGAATRLYENVDYSISGKGWIANEITLNAAPNLGDIIEINVYEIGGGDQLVKSSTKYDPIRENIDTGFQEILLNCNFSASLASGSGVYREGTTATSVIALETDSVTNSILVNSAKNLVINSIVYFRGDLIGGVSADTPYFIKTVSTATNSITVSDTHVSGVAGPTFELTTDSGSMIIEIQVGTGLVWTDPAVYYNGTKLVIGQTFTVTQTTGITNSITCSSTLGLSVGDRVSFSASIFGDVIQPQVT